MKEVVIVDTSIYLNILDVPGRNQDQKSTFDELQRLVGYGHANLLVPVATIFECGNHIAQVSDGRVRRSLAAKLAKQVRDALARLAPWTPMRWNSDDALLRMVERFPDEASRGLGFSDLSIIDEWETTCRLHPRRRVRIWSLDKHLAGYDRAPSAR